MKKVTIAITVVLILLMTACFGITANAAGAQSIKNAEITTSKESYVFRNGAVEPHVKVKLDVVDPQTGNTKKVKLEQDTDYTVAYADNINVGTATVTVTGIGNYKGRARTTFQIVPLDIGSKSVTAATVRKAFRNSAPTIQLKLGGAVLTEGKDYKVSYSNYATVGASTGVAAFTGSGNYTGTRTVYFDVYPSRVNAKVTKAGTNSVTLRWNSLSHQGVDGYIVYRVSNENGSNPKRIKTVSGNTATIKKLKSGEKYIFAVAAYKKNGSRQVNAALSRGVSTATKPLGVKLNYAERRNGNKLLMTWNKTHCSFYEIQYGTKNSLKNSKIARAKAKQSSKKLKIDGKSRYFVRIRAVTRYKVGNKVKYRRGAWSVKMSSDFYKRFEFYSTNYVNNPNRTNNLKLACKAINGTIVGPGETFSFNKKVGVRTKAKGYKPAAVFQGSNKVTDGIGGGICQVASTMFNASLWANFKIVERHQHSQRVTYCPLGRDAAIYWGSEDFKFKNNTSYPMKIKMTCAGGKLTCEYYTNYSVKPAKVKLDVQQSGKRFTLRRYAEGKNNYTTSSVY